MFTVHIYNITNTEYFELIFLNGDVELKYNFLENNIIKYIIKEDNDYYNNIYTIYYVNYFNIPIEFTIISGCIFSSYICNKCLELNYVYYSYPFISCLYCKYICKENETSLCLV